MCWFLTSRGLVVVCGPGLGALVRDKCKTNFTVVGPKDLFKHIIAGIWTKDKTAFIKAHFWFWYFKAHFNTYKSILWTFSFHFEFNAVTCWNTISEVCHQLSSKFFPRSDLFTSLSNFIMSFTRGKKESTWRHKKRYQRTPNPHPWHLKTWS